MEISKLQQLQNDYKFVFGYQLSQVKGWRQRLGERLVRWGTLLGASFNGMVAGSGERVIEDICDKGMVFKSTFVVGDPYSSAMNEGMRRMALSILKAANLDTQEMMKLLKREADKRPIV